MAERDIAEVQKRLTVSARLCAVACLLLLVLASPTGRAQDSQEQLRQVQKELQARGYEVGPIDGIMGPRTKAAIEEFQRKSGIPVTGIADGTTQQALSATRQATPPAPSAPSSPPAARETPRYPYPPAPSQSPPAQSPPPPQKGPGYSYPTPSKETGGNTGAYVLLALVIGGIVLWWRRRNRDVPSRGLVGRSDGSTLSAAQTNKGVDERGPIRIEISTSFRTSPISVRSSSRPSPETLKEQSSRCWMGAGKSLTIAGYELRGGLLYVGKELERQDGGGVENCLLNPSLSIAEPKGATPNVPYYPSFSTLEPSARGGYLQWLASGRDDPSSNVGFVFLYFYGLERRLLIDQASSEHDLLVAEVERLHRVYQKSYSVDRYARLLLDAARLVRSPRRFYEDTAPSHRRDYELPFSVRLAVGQLLAEGKSISWNWMYAWVLNDPETSLRTVHTRAEAELAELFRIRFEQKYPNGYKFNSPKARLKWSYRAASGTFEVDLQSKIGDLPDVINLSGPTNKMREILDGCAEELESYSRYLGRRPNGRGSLQSLSTLPAELAQRSESGEAKELRVWLDALLANGPTLVESGELITRLGIDANYGKSAVRSCAETLANFYVALMPNPRVSLQLPKLGQPFVLYRCGSAEIPEGEIAAFRLASLALTFAAFVAHADSTLSVDESRQLTELVHAARGLSDRGRLDLEAHLRWLQAVPAEPGALRTRLSTLSGEDRRQLGLVALSVASSDVAVHPAEIKALQRIYKILGLEEEGVLSDLHSAMASPTPAGLTAIQIAPNATQGFVIPKKTEAPSGGEIHLDVERLRHIGESTQRVNEILSKVFIEEEAEVTKDEVPACETDAADVAVGDRTSPLEFDGLDARYRGFLAELLTRAQWPRHELDMLARSHELMTDGALEAINEWAFDRHGDALMEDGDPITIQRQVIGEATTVANG